MKKSLAFCLTAALCLGSFDAWAGPNEDLWSACKNGNLDGVTKALGAGANVNAQDPDGGTAIAAAYLWPEVTKLLLSKGANPNLGTGSAVVGAAAYYSVEVLKMLLDAGADPNKPVYASSAAGIRKMIDAEKAKGKAANWANIKAWEGLVNSPAVKNAKPVEYYALRTSLYGSSCVPCVEMLLAKGAKLDKGITGGTMLHLFADSIFPTPEEWKKNYAASKSTLEGLGLKLPEWYAEVLAPERIGTADQMLKLLLDKGLNINQKGTSTGGLGGLTPLEITLNQGLGKKPHIMLALINAGADVKAVHPTYGPLIIQAVQTGLVDVVKAMIAKGANINQQGSVWSNATESSLLSTFTPLTAAAARNQLEVVKYLVPAGADKSIGVKGVIRVGTCQLDTKDRSALFFAIDNANLEMVQFLVENGGFDGKPFQYQVTRSSGAVGCILVGGFAAGIRGPSDWASINKKPAELIAYLKSKGL